MNNNNFESFWSSFRRYPKAGVFAGVCAGIAEKFEWNAKIVRLVAALSFFFGLLFPTMIVYGVLWYLMEPDNGMPGSFVRGSGANAASDHLPRPSRLDLGNRFSRMEARLQDMEYCVSSKEFELRRELNRL